MVGRDAEGQPIYFRHPAIQAGEFLPGSSLLQHLQHACSSCTHPMAWLYDRSC